jgi:selenocysteine-specific elongation factor
LGSMYFEAVLDLRVHAENLVRMEAFIDFKEKTRSSVFFYWIDEKQADKRFARIQLQSYVQVKWKDHFTLTDFKTNELIAEGRVMVPEVRGEIPENLEEHIAFLRQLDKKEDDMIFTLAKKKGIQGLNQEEILNFSRLSEKQVVSLCQSLEREKKIRIVSFHPVLIISRVGLDLLEKRILSMIENYSQADSIERGLDLEAIKDRIEVHPKLIALTVHYLKYSGKIREGDQNFVVTSSEENISESDERIIEKMDEMCRQGEFKNYSFEELQHRLRLSSERFHRLFDILLRRKKVIYGKDGFVFFSDWLDQLIGHLQKSRNKKLTVAEFKKISGLSRKYAIPLLELLDRKGVTKKEGSVHIIL